MSVQLLLLLLALAGGAAYVVVTSRLVQRWTRRPAAPGITIPAAPVATTRPMAEMSPDLAWLRGVRGLRGTFLLARTRNRVGRSSAGEIVLAVGTVSRHQCTIHHDGTGWVVVAEPSRNGTFLNSARLTPQQHGRLHDGDRVGLGENVELEIFIPDQRGKDNR
jgi:hypothetical protein